MFFYSLYGHGLQFRAIGIELFASAEEIKDIHSHDKSLMEKLTLIETLSDEEKQTLFNILDAFVSKKKYKDTLSGLLNDVK